MKNEYVDSKIIGSDLCALARLLIEYQLCQDTSSLENAGQTCMYLSEETNWQYDLGKVSFKIDKVGGKIPFDAFDISASLSIEIKGGIITEGSIIDDPLDHLIFDLEIEGFRENQAQGDFDNLYSSWHLDRHIFEDGNGKTKYSHPIYHFTFGGNKMEDRGNVYGSCLILPSPRISYPPMDAVLGIDFILQNYIHKDTVSGIMSNPEYIGIIRRAQERLLKPYFLSVASFWNETLFNEKRDYIVSHDHFSNRLLYPLFYY